MAAGGDIVEVGGGIEAGEGREGEEEPTGHVRPEYPSISNSDSVPTDSCVNMLTIYSWKKKTSV